VTLQNFVFPLTSVDGSTVLTGTSHIWFRADRNSLMAALCWQEIVTFGSMQREKFLLRTEDIIMVTRKCSLQNMVKQDTTVFRAGPIPSSRYIVCSKLEIRKVYALRKKPLRRECICLQMACYTFRYSHNVLLVVFLLCPCRAYNLLSEGYVLSIHCWVRRPCAPSLLGRSWHGVMRINCLFPFVFGVT